MARFLFRGAMAGTLALTIVSAGAQEMSEKRVETHTDWSVFVETDPPQCWIVSAPKETVNTKDGRVVSVKRGEIMLFANYQPDRGPGPVISLTGGYPYADDSTVSVVIGEDSFELFTLAEDDAATPWPENEYTWPEPSDDARLLAAMKRGTTAVVTGRSARGTVTKDTFSLFGFTAALEDAEKRCGG